MDQPNRWLESLGSLTLFYKELLLPLKDSLPQVPADSYLEREEDPLWHLGHACFDCARALLLAYGQSLDTVHRHQELYLGLNARHPWDSPRPEWAALVDWWEQVLKEVELALKLYDQSPQEIIILDQYPLTTARKAFDYVLFHSGFHIGRVHQLLGW